MAAILHLPCPIQGQRVQAAKPIRFPNKGRTRTTNSSFSWNERKKVGMHDPRINKQWLLASIGSRGGQQQPCGFTASDVVLQLYDCINDKKLKNIQEFVDKDCYFEDYSFAKPFQGKREVIGYFEQLAECMGDNVKFTVTSACKGDDLSVVITWHLEWKGKHIPFTRGCSFYECSNQGDRLVIRHVRALIESPIKPGALALSLFKVITYLFDEFPGVAEKFLQKPHVILEFLQRIYSVFLEPFIKPVMEFYVSFWKLVARTLGYMISMLIQISRIFLK